MYAVMAMVRALVLVLALIVPVFSAGAWATQPEVQPEQPAISTEFIQSRIAHFEQATEIDEATRTAILERLRDALLNLQRFEDSTARMVEFNRLTAEAPAFLEQIRAELSAPPADPRPNIPPDATLSQLEQGLEQARAELAAARQQAEYWQNESSRRVERRPVALDLVSQLRARVSELDQDIRGLATAEPSLVIEARRVAAQAQRMAAMREIEALEAEVRCYDARRDITPARRDRALRQVGNADKLIEIFQRLVSDRRQLEAQAAALEAERLRREAARQHPVLQEFADRNKELADLRVGREGTTQRIDQDTEDLRQMRVGLAAMREGYQSVRRRIVATGLNRATGLLLRRQYEMLPNVSDLKRSLRTARQQLEQAQVTLIERQEERSGAGDISTTVESLMQQVGPVESETVRLDIEAVARELAINRRDTLDRLVADATTHFNLLIEVEETTQEYLAAASAYERFIEERILWIRSVSVDGLPRLQDFAKSIALTLDPSAWAQAFELTWRSAIKRTPVSVGLALLTIASFVVARRCRKLLKETAKSVGSYRTDSFEHTLRAFAMTAGTALPLPLFLWNLGWICASPIDQGATAIALAHGLQSAALLGLPLIALSRLAQPGGLLDAHFRWPTASVRAIRLHLHWFITPTLIAFGISEYFERLGVESSVATLGRLAFTTQLVLLSLWLERVLRPHGAVIGEYCKRNPDGAIDRLRYVWFPLVVALPLLFATVSWLGYHYTAIQLESRFQATLALILSLILINAFLQRWLFLARRKVAIEDARRRREQARGESTGADGGAPIEEEKLDLPAISAQTQQLFRLAIVVSLVLGLYATWASVLPALKMLDRVEVWPRMHIAQGDRDGVVPELELAPFVTDAPDAPPATTPSASPASGSTTLSPTGLLSSVSSPAESPATSTVVVTLADLGLGFIVLLATILAFRNLPGLVEIVVLQQLPLDAGSRYALSTVLRYVIAIVGITIAFNAIGISWSKVQWLAAALTFGLAFGLQEIFANFVSGLIILAERPIRVGDTVTVGGVSGNVTRIRMRATTITDWDRKELIIPNRTFITDQVINWTLTDPVLRVIIPVGVSYGSDVDKVVELLLRVANQNQLVLRDPPPQALFLGFGDSTLNFEVRCHIASISNFVATRHQMHMGILKTFRENDVEIAFPQRDLHLRTADARIQIVREDPSGETAVAPIKVD